MSVHLWPSALWQGVLEATGLSWTGHCWGILRCPELWENSSSLDGVCDLLSSGLCRCCTLTLGIGPHLPLWAGQPNLPVSFWGFSGPCLSSPHRNSGTTVAWDTVLVFYMGSGGSNSGPHSCTEIGMKQLYLLCHFLDWEKIFFFKIPVLKG